MTILPPLPPVPPVMTSLRNLESAATGPMVNGKTHADTSPHALNSSKTTHVRMLMTGQPATKVRKDKHGLPNLKHASTTRPKNSGQLSSNAGKNTQLKSEITYLMVASDAATIE